MAVRKLSSLERYFYLRSILQIHSCFYVCVQLNQLPSRAQLQEATKRTIAKFNELHCNVAIDNKDGEPFFQLIERSLQFDDVVEYVSWDEFDPVRINEVFQNYVFSYNTQKPLWKILIIPNERKLVLLMSHVIFDGMSGVIIWKDLLENLNQCSASIKTDSDKVFVPLEGQHFDSDHHPYGDFPISWKGSITKFLLGQYFKWRPISPNSFGPSPDQFQYANYSFPDGLLRQRKDSIAGLYQIRNDNLQWNLHLDPQAVQKILRLCRKHEVSLTSMLAALVTFSIIECKADQSYTGSNLTIEVPINTRSACNKMLKNKQYADKLGNFVASLTLRHNIDDKISLWQLAKKLHSSLRESQDGVHSGIERCKLLDVVDVQQFLEAKVAASNPGSTFEVSNLGYHAFNESQGPFEVENAYFNQPQGISSIFFCSVISTKGGLNCNITYPKDLEKELGPCFQYCKNWLQRETNN